MKLAILFILSILILSGCNKDDITESRISESLDGKWLLIKTQNTDTSYFDIDLFESDGSISGTAFVRNDLPEYIINGTYANPNVQLNFDCTNFSTRSFYFIGEISGENKIDGFISHGYDSTNAVMTRK